MTIYLKRRDVPPSKDEGWIDAAKTNAGSDIVAIEEDIRYLEGDLVEEEKNIKRLKEPELVPEEPKPVKTKSKARDIFISVGRALSGFQNISVTSPRINGIPLVSAAVYGEQVVHPQMKSVKTKSSKIKKHTVKPARVKSAGKIIKQNSVPVKKLKFQSIKKAYRKEK
jgi:hypothetical protein